MDMTPPPTLSIYPEIRAGAELKPLSQAPSSFPVQSALPLVVVTRLFTLLAGAIKDLTGRVQTAEPPKPDVAKQWLPPEGAPPKSEPQRPTELHPAQRPEQAPVHDRQSPRINPTAARMQPQTVPHTKDACQKIVAEERRSKEKSLANADISSAAAPVSRDHGELPFAFVVPYTSFKFEDRFAKIKRKKDPREEVLEELEEREREEEEEKLLEE